MAGTWNHLIYDGCATNWRLNQSITPGSDNYALYVGAHENDLNTKYCNENKDCSIPNTWSSIGKRTTIENNLLDIDNRATLCNDDKHKPCDKNSKEPMCNIGIQCTPYLCNRDIVPTNMKMPNSCGF